MAFQIAAFVRRFLIDHQVDIVHTHRCKDTVLGTLAATCAAVPHVVRTVHGLSEALRGWKRAKLVAYEALDKATLWCFADCVVAVSNQIAATLRGSRFRPRAVSCIHNGINLQELRATRSSEDVRRALGIRADAVVIGSAGRLAPVKGHEYLVRAAPHVLAAEPRARFLFVGSGPLRAELMALAATLAVDHACVFHDPNLDDHVGVYDLIAAMDVFALPSLSEGVPLALLEAMALGDRRWQPPSAACPRSSRIESPACWWRRATRWRWPPPVWSWCSTAPGRTRSACAPRGRSKRSSPTT